MLYFEAGSFWLQSQYFWILSHVYPSLTPYFTIHHLKAFKMWRMCQLCFPCWLPYAKKRKKTNPFMLITSHYLWDIKMLLLLPGRFTAYETLSKYLCIWFWCNLFSYGFRVRSLRNLLSCFPILQFGKLRPREVMTSLRADNNGTGKFIS